jgi:hypothetical protein
MYQIINLRVILGNCLKRIEEFKKETEGYQSGCVYRSELSSMYKDADRIAGEIIDLEVKLNPRNHPYPRYKRRYLSRRTIHETEAIIKKTEV